MQKTLKHEMKADYLLKRGMELLWSKGYNATSVNDIVQVAEVPKGSFYFYFESKEDFAVKAIEMYFQENFSPAEEILNNKSISPRQRLLDFYEFRTNMLKNELQCTMGCLACNVGNEMAEHSENIRKTILKNGELIRSKITRVMVEAQENGEIDPSLNAADVVAFLEDAGKGAMTTMKEMKSAYPIDNLMAMVRTIIIK